MADVKVVLKGNKDIIITNGKYVDGVTLTTLSDLKSLSQSTSDASTINYGVLANSGSITVIDKDGIIAGYIEDGSLPVSNVPVEIYVNDNLIQKHITTDSSYDVNSKELTISLSNSLDNLSKITYSGWQYTGVSATLYDILYDVMNTYYGGELDTDTFDEMLSEQIIYGPSDDYGIISSYLKDIVVEYPYIEANQTIETIVNEICTIAQLQVYLDDDGNIKFTSGRPVVGSGNYIYIPKKGLADDFDRDLVLKNKYDGVNISEYELIATENDTIWTSPTLLVYDSDHNFIGSDEGINPSNYSVSKVGTEYYRTVIIFDVDLSTIDKIFLTENFENNFSLRINWTRDSYNYVVTLSTISLNGESLALGSSSKIEVYTPDDTSSYYTYTYDSDSKTLSFIITSSFLEGLPSGGYSSGNHYYGFTTSVSFNILATTYSFSEVDVSTDDISSAENVVSYSTTKLLQTGTKYNGTKLSDIIKDNILSDYASGVKTANTTLNSIDFVDRYKDTAKTFSNGEIIDVCDILGVYGQSDSNGIIKWKTTGRQFNYDGETTTDIELVESKTITPVLTYSYNSTYNAYEVYAESDDISGTISVASSYNDGEHGTLSVVALKSGAFQNMTNLTSVSLPTTITYIGDYAFANSGITSFTFPSSVTSTGSYVFQNCKSLKSVTFGSGLTTLASYLFYGCTALSTLTSVGSIKIIGKYAFYGCSSLTSFTMSSNLLQILGYAFASSGLTSVTIPSNVTTIENYAFRSCVSLKTATVSSSDTTVAGIFWGCTGLTTATLTKATYIYDTFYGCTSLTSVDLPTTLITIGTGSFYNCTSLSSLTIPSSVTTIEQFAFENCTALSTIAIPNSVTTIGANIFNGCSSSLVINCDLYSKPSGWSDTWNYYGSDSSKILTVNWLVPLIFSAVDDGYAVTGIVDGAESEILELVIPDTYNNEPVTTISSNAFSGATKMWSITFGENITTIEDEAFNGCYNLLRVISYSDIGNMTIGENAFKTCYKLVEIFNQSSTLTIGSTDYGYIGYYALYSYLNTTVANNEKIRFDNSGEYAFVFSESTTSYYYYYLLAYLGDDTDITLPTIQATSSLYGYYGLYQYAFYGNSKIKTITLNEYVTTSTLVKSYTMLNEYTFGNCTSLTTFDLPSDMTEIPAGLFYGCSSLTSIDLPSATTSIGSSAFSNCTSLAEIILPDTVTTINTYAFENCTALTMLFIPISVTTISTSSVIGPFYGCSSNLILYCEASSKQSGWGTYWNYYSVQNTLTTYYSYSRIDLYGKTVTFISDGTTVSTQKLLEGDSPTAPTNPTKTGYTFQYWTVNGVETDVSSYVVTGDVTFTAYFTINTYTVTFITYDSNMSEVTYSTQTVTYGSYATTPTDPTLENYTFQYWAINNSEVDVSTYQITKATTFYAYFTADKEQAGLYDADSGMLTMTWDELIENEYITVSSGTLIQGSSSDRTTALAGKLVVSEEISIITNNGALSNTSTAGAFASCSSLTEIVLPDTITNIGSGSFYNCSKLTTINIPEGVTNIGYYAFYNCSKLAELTLPSTLAYICAGAFQNCSALTSIWIPNATACIYDYIVSSSMASVSYAPFSGCSSSLVIYCEASLPQSNWGTYWNYLTQSLSTGYIYATTNYGYSYEKYLSAIS